MEYQLTGTFSKNPETPFIADKFSEYGEEEPKKRRRRRRCGCSVWVLLVILVLCGIGCFVMMSTNFFNLAIQRNLTLRKNSMRYEIWRQPPVHALLRVYLFNYTNIEDYESGIDKKLNVEELGPYTYIETIERVNVSYGENGTLTYKDKKMYKFSRELSNGSESDIVIVPNIPFMAAVAFGKSQGLITNLAVTTGLKAIGAEPFIRLSASEFLWGYNDNLSKIASYLLVLKTQLKFSSFGILANKNQTQEDNVTIYTGENDVTKTGVIYRYDKKSALDYWETIECNRIDGTDGTIYPLDSIKENSTLYLYVKDMCRRVPMVYESSKTDQHGIPVLRYNLARNVFASGEENPENQCFCSKKDRKANCMPSGVFNVSPCVFGVPLITSLPHFLYGDSILLENFQGLSPHPELHESFVEIDPRLGFPLSGKSRFQLNVMVKKGAALAKKPYKDGLILPVSWMDYGVDRLPDELSSLMYNLLFVIDMTEICLSFSFVAAIVIVCALIIKKIVPKKRSGLYVTNLDLSTVEMPLVTCPGKT